MKDSTKTKIYKIISIILLTIMFLYMCLDANTQSFWVDELDWTIEYLAKNNILAMLSKMISTGYNLPLFYIIMNPIYHIAPYGEFWLLLPNFIMVIAGILILRKTAKIIGGEDLSFIATCLSAISFVLLTQCAFELRPYALLFLTSVFLLYRYILLMNDNNLKNKIWFTVAMILSAYTHWFGCLIITCYFVYDCLRWITKKIKLNFIIPYLITGIVFLPWFILLIKNNGIHSSEYWGTIPNLSLIFSTIQYLLSNNRILYLLFLIGSFLTLLYMYIGNREKTKYYLLCLGSIIWVIVIVFFYSKFINPKGSLYVFRYFMVLFPHIIIVTSLFLSELLNLKIFINNKEVVLKINDFELNYNIIFVTIMCVIAFVGLKSYSSVHDSLLYYYEPYRQFSNFVINNSETYKNNNAILTSSGTGYLTYYFKKRNIEVPPAIYLGNNDIYQVIVHDDGTERIKINKKDLLQYDTLFLIEIHEEFSEEFLEFISENYELTEQNDVLKLYTYKKITNKESNINI